VGRKIYCFRAQLSLRIYACLLRPSAQRRATPLAIPALIGPASLPRKLLCALPELRLQRNVARTLDRSQKTCEFLLLCFHYRDSLFLDPDRPVKEIAHVLLIGGVAGHHLLSELTPHLAFLRAQLPQLRSKPRVRFFELVELRVGEPQPLLRELGRAFAELLFESGPVSLWRARHRLRVKGCGEHEQSEDR
jgi:hypothetical protein